MARPLATAALLITAALPLAARAQLKDPAPPAHAAAAQPADVPVKQVVLFSSGVGYFEHFGTVKGDGSTELRFKTDQINDVLKSLVLQDLDKGQVSTVTYPSQEPIARTLKSFQVDITTNPPLADLLNQLRGARIDATLADGKVVGTIVGVEKRDKEVGDKGTIVSSWVLNLKVGPRFRAVPLEQMQDFALQDPKLEEELDKALAALAGARDQDKKPVTLNFRGQGERRVRIGYVVETPIWKTSYRLVLSDADGAGENKAAAGAPPQTEPGRAGPDRGDTPRLGSPDRGDTPRLGSQDRGDAPRPRPLQGAASRPAPHAGKLQGWAIVENQTDNDWTDVQLSLVSGRPISFIQDLYHPLYVPRPVVLPDLYATLRPQTYKGGISDEEVKKLKDAREGKEPEDPGADLQLHRQPRGGSGGGAGGGGGGLFGAGGTGGQRREEPMDPTASVAAAASAGALGELFQYTVGSVSLPRQKSAMIPIVTDDVEVEKLSIYNANVLPGHPLNGARVKNTTGKHLLQGPITVFEAGGYAGDARIDDVPPGQSRYVSYGVDLNVTADPSGESDLTARETVQVAKIVKGVMELTVKDEAVQKYVFRNQGDAGRTVIVEHPRVTDWHLVEPKSADETTDDLYRLRVRVDAGQAAKFNVKTEGVSVLRVVLLPTEVGPLVTYATNGEIAEKVRTALGRVIELKSAMADTQRKAADGKKQLADVSAEQTRIRENLKTVAQNTDYYNRLLKKLDEQETQIESLQKDGATLAKKQETQKQELEAFVKALDVE